MYCDLATRVLNSGLRLGFDKYDYTTEGRVSLKKIYRGVGNGEVDVMMQQYFPEMCKFTRIGSINQMIR